MYCWSPVRACCCMNGDFPRYAIVSLGSFVNSIIGALQGRMVMGVAAVVGKHTAVTRDSTWPRAANLGMHVVHVLGAAGINCEQGRAGRLRRH